MKPRRVFIHGLDSSGMGTKGLFFRNKYPDTIVEDFVGPFKDRMEKLKRILSGKTPLILVGSSYGGLMAAVYALNSQDRVEKLILLAPALNIVEFEPYLEKKTSVPVVIFHGRDDDVVSPGEVEKIARRVFTNLDHHLVDDDHSLHKTFSLMDWDALLEAGGKQDS
ncbi:MAG TPA: alpha/beta fold hydrolase [Syntrophales bacterium]|nr:alpha/beta fold hydrolase [Syntrophales bacterium]